jgi:hypothetical protein
MPRAALILPFLLASCAMLHEGGNAGPFNPDAAPSAAELRGWKDDACVRAGKRLGIDYAAALERAIRRDPTGLADLFRYTDVGEMDGGAGEAHSAILFGLLQRWGDQPFAEVLRSQKLPIRKAVIGNLPTPSESGPQFPLTYASAGG